MSDLATPTWSTGSYPPDDSPRNLAIIPIADAFLLDLMRNGSQACVVARNAVPEDARIVGVQFDGRTLELMIEGTGLPSTAPGCQIVKQNVWFNVVLPHRQIFKELAEVTASDEDRDTLRRLFADRYGPYEWWNVEGQHDAHQAEAV